ncbi:hypothetical protein [Nannocystis sp. SCPEA4]|uniref:hypothetical protein n=1 Tax=Nannocystis sp. SCPEA4 TaxID=2996787 RepID=UPI00226DC31F|nr:hypothetical protein [Nannocystis sp. SCPEA4]MCY1057118.1 hypothetical protein [Nannocystis sp. SCPEA4]
MRSRLLAPVFAALLAAAATGCRPPEILPPYAAGQAPKPDELLGTAAPKISALQVPVAKIRIGRAPSGNLMFLAQKPGRFSGQIQIAGHEFVSLAFNERGYTLRNVAADNLPTGFFAGPPADCAIQRLLGVPFATQELVSLVLGGAPVLAPPYEVVSQSWDARHGHEVLRLRAPGYEQELRFAHVDGVWWPAGGTLWQRRSDGQLARMWSLLHEELHPVDGTVLPRRTRLAGPSTRRQDLVIITYGAQTVDPDLGDSAAAQANEDDAGWEDEDTAAAPSEGEGDAPEAPAPADTPPAPNPSQPPAQPEPSIPPQFTLDGAGLAPRGELCR